MRDPSKGGIGIRLKTAKMRLSKIPICKIDAANGKILILRISARTTAIKIFVMGPEIPTQIMSFFGFLNLEKLTGTGFAQPKIIGELVRKRNNGKIIVPNKSTCLMGLRVNRPRSFAVGSPS